ncbi:hypothetical protein JDV02_001409 [Purpureocillium takamizusanense]|uniref:Uncharacterized protein n=1 Tax=Purpureocillium takamizusanense TaxID=2060973 RepID=A0A9Q8Q8V0_9HYPO|nr:uncharacterized protein JDV02_001409 [Purpureocillium takamizusanense]UNI14816.1 hypothetical protein JDV02_001409 [Purpureocillium takamizusanense]
MALYHFRRWLKVPCPGRWHWHPRHPCRWLSSLKGAWAQALASSTSPPFIPRPCGPPRLSIPVISFMSPKRKAEDNQPARISLADLVHTLYREGTHRYAELAGVLAVNPEIVSWARSLLSTQPYGGPATPSDTPSPASGNVNDRLFGAGSKATPLPTAEREVQKYRKILPYPSSAGSPSIRLAVCADRPGPSGTPQENRGESSAPPDETNEEPETERRKRAKVKADSEYVNLGQENCWFELRKELAATRNDALDKLQALKVDPPSEQSAQAEVVNDISALHRKFRGKKAGHRFTVFRKRYDRWLTAKTLQRYYDAQSSAKSGQALQAVVVAKAVLGDQVSRMSDKQVQTKWKEESRKNKFWHRLVEEFGCAILQILSPRWTDENARNLSNKDVDAFISSVKNKWPSLRENTKDLSDMLSHFAETGSLPDERLCLELVSDGQIFSKSSAQLLSYSTQSGRASVVVAQQFDPPPSAPAPAPAADRPTTSDANASEMATMEDPMMPTMASEEFGAAHATADAADMAEVFQRLSPLLICSSENGDGYNTGPQTSQDMLSLFNLSPSSEHWNAVWQPNP